MQITANTDEFTAQQLQHYPLSHSLTNTLRTQATLELFHHPSTLEVFTVAEAAAMLHQAVPKSAIYQLINSGELHAKKVGNKYLIPKKAIEEFLDCRDENNQHDCGTGRMKMSGSSSTTENKCGQDIAMNSARKLKMLSANT